MRYTFSDEEDEGDSYSDATTSRRSTRNTRTHTPAEGLGAPTVTSSGRQVKPRQGGNYGESILSGAQPSGVTVGGYDGTSEEPENHELNGTRPRRAAAAGTTRGWASKGQHIEGYNSVDEMEDEDEDDASGYGDDEDEDEHVPLESDVDDPDELTDADDIMDELSAGEKKSMIVKLPIKTPTPEKKKSAAQDFLSTEKDSALSTGTLQSGIDEQRPGTTVNGVASSTAHAANGTPRESIQAQPNSSVTAPEASSRPDEIPPKSPRAQSPWSPSLTSRGSPEKPTAFPTSINVG